MFQLVLLLSTVILFQQVESFSPRGTARRPHRTTVELSVSKSTQTASSDASRLKRVASLTDWAKASDIKLGGVCIGQSDLDGLGLLTTQQVPSGSVVMTVPSNIALSVESPGGGVDDASVVRELVEDRRAVRDLPWFCQFSLYLHALKKVSSVKQNNNMRPWLDSLPRSFDTPIHWSQSALQELQYPHLVQSVSRQEQEWKRLYNELLNAGTSRLKSTMTFDDFVWGCECARSRAFSGAYTGSAFNPLIYAFTLLLVTAYVGLNLGTLEQAANGAAVVVCASILKDFVLPKLFKKKRFVICPVIDMANHASIGVSADVSFEFFGDAYSLASSRSIEDGKEVFISYGARSNDQLLQYYGFVEKDNPHDVYVMPPLREWDIGALEAACGRQFSPGRLEKLDRAGLLGSAQVNDEDDSATTEAGAANPLGGVVITHAGGVDPAVMQALRALVSTEDEWISAGEAIGNFAAELSGGAENERLARLAARTAVEQELASKPTTRTQDEALLNTAKSSRDGSREETLAIEFRIEKKKLLEETLEKLK